MIIKINQWCRIKVTRIRRLPPHRGSAHTCQSDIDYSGEIEVDYRLVDIHTGELLPELEKQITPKIHEEIIERILEYEKKSKKCYNIHTKDQIIETALANGLDYLGYY